MNAPEMRRVAESVDRQCAQIDDSDADGLAVCLILSALADKLRERAAALEAQ